MAQTKFYLDIRTSSSLKPLKLTISHRSKSALLNLDIKLQPEQWDNAQHIIINHPAAKSLNAYISKRKADADMTISNLTTSGEIATLTAQDIKKILSGEMAEEQQRIEDANLFISRFQAFINKKTNRTKEIYTATLNHLKKFDKDITTRRFEDITKEWLEQFDSYLMPVSPSPNGRAIHFRNIRAVFNDALDDEITHFYPFRKFKIKTIETEKRSLTADELRLFFNYPCEPHQEQYRDLFQLIFLLAGINIIDLLHLKKIEGGRIHYHRSKTHRLYNIKVEPEALQIIDKYKGQNWLINPLDRYSNYKDFAQRLNMNLGQIGEVKRVGLGGKKVRTPLFPDITTYWARHSWATIAAELDIPKETIAHALGHGQKTVTDIYIRYDEKKVDEANRRVIDYVLYNKK